MRILYFWMAAALFMMFAMARGTAVAGEEVKEVSTVPYMLSQVQDETLRSALSQYKPDYDTVSRQEQVGSFVNLYTALYREQPPLSAADAQMNAARAASLAPPAFAPSYEPWRDPSWNPRWDFMGLRMMDEGF